MPAGTWTSKVAKMLTLMPITTGIWAVLLGTSEVQGIVYHNAGKQNIIHTEKVATFQHLRRSEVQRGVILNCDDKGHPLTTCFELILPGF